MSNSLDTHQILVSVVVVSFNTRDLTLQTLDSVVSSLKNNDWFKKIEIIVVDNHSADESVSACQTWLEKHPIQGRVIAAKDNLGFSGANNLGIQQGKGKYYFLLNSDRLVQPGAIENLVACFERYQPDQLSANTQTSTPTDNLGVLAATLLNPDQSSQPQGGDLPSLLSLATQWLFWDELPIWGKKLPNLQHTGRSASNELNHWKKNGVSAKGWVGGTALMIKSEVFAEIGLLDDNIFMYGEDIEFCQRARNHHWDIGLLITAKVIHLGSQSAGKSAAILGEIKGIKYLWAKHRPVTEWRWAKMILFLGISLRWIMYNVRGNSELAHTYRQAFKLL